MDQINEDDNDQPENLSKEGANSTEQVELIKLEMDQINEDDNDQPENLSKEGANSTEQVPSTGKSLSEALLFAENGENMLCTKIVFCLYFDIQNNLW